MQLHMVCVQRCVAANHSRPHILKACACRHYSSCAEPILEHQQAETAKSKQDSPLPVPAVVAVQSLLAPPPAEPTVLLTLCPLLRLWPPGPPPLLLPTWLHALRQPPDCRSELMVTQQAHKHSVSTEHTQPQKTCVPAACLRARVVLVSLVSCRVAVYTDLFKHMPTHPPLVALALPVTPPAVVP